MHPAFQRSPSAHSWQHLNIATIVLWEQHARVNSYMFKFRQNKLLCFKYTMSYQIYYGVFKGRFTVFFIAKMISFQRLMMPLWLKKLAWENSICAFPCFVKILFVNALEPSEHCHKYLAWEQAREGHRWSHKAVEDVGYNCAVRDKAEKSLSK